MLCFRTIDVVEYRGAVRRRVATEISWKSHTFVKLIVAVF